RGAQHAFDRKALCHRRQPANMIRVTMGHHHPIDFPDAAVFQIRNQHPLPDIVGFSPSLPRLFFPRETTTPVHYDHLSLRSFNHRRIPLSHIEKSNPQGVFTPPPEFQGKEEQKKATGGAFPPVTGPPQTPAGKSPEEIQGGNSIAGQPPSWQRRPRKTETVP